MRKLNDILISFIKDEILDPDFEITADLSLEDDLGISGDDASEFILAFSKKFKVNIEGFNFNDYFNSEPSLLTSSSKKALLTIGMLNNAIDEGKL